MRQPPDFGGEVGASCYFKKHGVTVPEESIVNIRHLQHDNRVQLDVLLFMTYNFLAESLRRSREAVGLLALF